MSISTSATLDTVKQKEAEMLVGSKVLIFNYDTGVRYLSIDDLFFLIENKKC